MLSNRDVYSLVTTVYSDYGYSYVDSSVINRFVDNYVDKVDYHKLLLNGKDRIEIEDTKGIVEIINEVADFLVQRINNTYCDYFLTTFDYKEVTIDEKGRVFIKGKRLHKYISDILEGHQEYLNETYEEHYSTTDKDVFMSIKRVDKLTLEQILQKLTVEAMIKVVISARPDDFILCSEKTTGWNSCFRIDGEYHNSTNSFYCDNRFLVSYILSSSGKKIGRRWIHIDYEEEIISNGKQYGTYGVGVAKAVREYIQKLVDSKDTWVSYDNDCNDNDADGVYCDSGYRTSYKKEKGRPMDWSIYDSIPEGLNCNGEAGEGVFSDDRYVCPDCGDRFSSDDGYFIESRDESVCSSCGDRNYFWCEGYDVYVDYEEGYIDIGSYRYSIDYAIVNGYAVRSYDGDLINAEEAVWLEDMQEYVHENDDYYNDSDGVCWSMDYFKDNFVMACDTGEYIHKDNANYSEILDAYFEDYIRMEEVENEKRD